MLKRDITQLAIYQSEEEIETLPLACIRSLFLEKTSEIIYIIKDKKLYGIVCLGDILRHSQNGEIKINKTFMFMTGYNIVKAHEIFQTKRNIHKIPVVNEEGELIGDYSRWDDMLYIERNWAWFMREEALKRVLESYETIYLIEPVENDDSYYLRLIECFKYLRISYIALNKEQIVEKLSEKAICIFLNEDEMRGVQCLYGVDFGRVGAMSDIQCRLTLVTYRSLLLQIIEEDQLERLKIEKPVPSICNRLNDKATIFLSELKKRGVNCFCIYSDESESTQYGKKFMDEVNERLKTNPVNPEEPWPKKIENKEFFGELYRYEDYEKEIAQKEIVNGHNSFEYKMDINGKFFNAQNGRRITCFQPEEYIGSIYFLGPCMVVGGFIEDQYTIESCLQKKLLEKGYAYRVENYGGVLRTDSELEKRLEEIGKYGTNDIVIYLSTIGKLINIEGSSLERIFEKYQIPSEWVTNSYLHCNHKVNQLVADCVLEMIEPCLLNVEAKDNHSDEIQINFHHIMKDYVQHKYLDQYFLQFFKRKYNTVGAIVMNCNPFSKGHRYLIDQAKQRVDFLIVFVVEEDLSLFPFEERIKLIKEGTKDIDNIMIVPSGDFILSKNNFREYFLKHEDEVTALNAEYDINIFADYIAKPLHITHRFAGEEPEDKVTKIYNETMRRILPQKGIDFIEIPRMMLEGEIISASRVRKYLKDAEYDKAFILLPETTMQYLRGQI